MLRESFGWSMRLREANTRWYIGGSDSQWNYCSCYDFKTSQLGTCKHMEAVKLWVRKKRKKVQVAEPDYSSVYIDYKGPRRVKIRHRRPWSGNAGAIGERLF